MSDVLPPQSLGPRVDSPFTSEKNISLRTSIDGERDSADPEETSLTSFPPEVIDQIAANIPGGLANLQDVRPVTSLLEILPLNYRVDEIPELCGSQLILEVSDRNQLDALLLELQRSVERYDILRSAVMWAGLNAPLLTVWRQAQLNVVEASLDSSGDDVVQQIRLQFALTNSKIDLTRAPLMRVAFASDAVNRRWVVLILFHSLLGDVTSLRLFGDRILAQSPRATTRSSASVRNCDHNVQAQPREHAEAHSTFFRRMLGTIDEPTLPFGIANVSGTASELKYSTQTIERSLLKRIRSTAHQLGVSTASLCHLAWAKVVGHLSGREDVVFGTVMSHRTQAGLRLSSALGIFHCTLPLRITIGGKTIKAAVRETHAHLTELLGHMDASLPQALRCSGLSASGPLFSALMNYRDEAHCSTLEDKSGRKEVGILLVDEFINYVLCLNIDDLGDEFKLTVEGANGIDPKRVCSYMHKTLERLIDGLEQNPDVALNRLSILPQDERTQQLETFNATNAMHPPEQTVHALFEAQVKRTPDAVAVVYGGEKLTYGTLNARANQLAHHLIELGVKRDDRVAICVRRCPAMVVGLLAILKAGAGYVPLDPQYPAERLAYMLSDSAPAVVLTHASTTSIATGAKVVEIKLDAPNPRWATQPQHDPTFTGRGATSSHLAYVIYTSGSTGQPKGVAMPHGPLTNLLHWQIADSRRGGNETGRTLQFAALGFDVAFQEIFGTLCAGATLELINEELRADFASLFRHICQRKIERLYLPYVALQGLAEAVSENEMDVSASSIREVITAGEQLRITPQIKAFFDRLGTGRLDNHYGPTESHVVTAISLSEQTDNWKTLPSIGRSIANTRIYLLDDEQELVPMGVPGEIYISGAGLARGYLYRAALTAERFVPDPFSKDSGGRMYKTGDLGRWLPDGNLEYLGRNDHQVKIRGFRVELGEIEAQLALIAGVKEAVVLSRDDTLGEKRLVAYYTGTPLEAETLRMTLLSNLPEHMVPTAFVRVRSLPLTPNGKLDRRALPDPTMEAFPRQAYEPPQGEAERAITGIWSDILGVHQPSRHDNFFALGGHSILAAKLASRLQRIRGVNLSMSTLFANPTIALLGSAITALDREEDIAIQAARRDIPLPLSFGQQRLWFLNQLNDSSAAYHIPIVLCLSGELDVPALHAALNSLFARHEALRTIFNSLDGVPHAGLLSSETALPLVEVELRDGEHRNEALESLFREEAQRPFDFVSGPLIRAKLLRTNAKKHYLILTLHHIVSDGWSIAVLARDLSALYTAFSEQAANPLSPLAVQYPDYAAWQRRWLDSERVERQVTYWRKTLGDAPALLALPTDRPRPAQQSFSGAAIPVLLDAELTQALKRLSEQHGVTLFMTLLAAWAAVLSRLADQDDLVIGVPVANRNHTEFESLIGFFVNTLAMRIDLSGKPDVAQLLAQVRGVALGANEHQDLPYEKVVEIIRPERNSAYTPLFQVMFAWQNNDVPRFELLGLHVEQMGTRYENVRFDLELDLSELDGTIRGALSYSTALFDAATVERQCGYLKTMLRGMVDALNPPVSQIALLAPSERELLINKWNDTQAPYPEHLCIHQLFEDQARRQPDAIAIMQAGQSLTYGQLNRRANGLARHLVNWGIKPEERVALCVDRSPIMIAALLGILKAGGAYVPLDPNYPRERLRHILSDANPKLLLADSLGASVIGDVDQLKSLDPVSLCANTDDSDLETGNTSSVNLAYVIYTSGSTGAPKGVMVEHRQFCNLIAWHGSTFGSRVGGCSAATAGVAFDASAWEIWSTLLHGGTLLLPPSARLDAVALLEWWRLQELDVTFLTTPLAEIALANSYTNEHLRYLLIGGDRLRYLRSLPPTLTLINNYGPTETAVVATSGKVESDDAVLSIGRPIWNTRVYILDSGGELVPVGAVGELYIGGAGVARGYLNRPDLTAERFVADPFNPIPGQRMYRTGDLARYMADGSIEFLGRNDHQVKVRGFRIELGEIEARLVEHPSVREAVVVTREVASEKYLVAYVVPMPGLDAGGAWASTLRAYLVEFLPEYMLPAAFVRLDSLPLTHNGKLDRKSLPEPGTDAFAHQLYEAPSGKAETILAGIWSELLGIRDVGRHDNFFALGGHSLLAAQLLARLERQQQPKLQMKDIFAAPTITELALMLEAKRESSSRPDNSSMSIPKLKRAI